MLGLCIYIHIYIYTTYVYLFGIVYVLVLKSFIIMLLCPHIKPALSFSFFDEAIIYSGVQVFITCVYSMYLCVCKGTAETET